MFENLIDKLLTSLSNDSLLKNFNFVNAFSQKIRNNPLNKITVSIGLGSVKISNVAFGDFLGNTSSGEVYGKQADVDIKIQIHSPKSLGGRTCCEAFSLISNSIIFNLEEPYLVSIYCSEVCYDDGSCAFILPCNAKFKIYLGKQTDQTKIEKIIVKGGV